jgi:hypothetical protein
MKKRIKIPNKIGDEVMIKSQGRCYCGKRGDQIHHIDKNPSNNDFDNLILLCYDHHHEAEVIGGLKKKLTLNQLKKRRNDLYVQNEKRNRLELKHYSSTLKKITDENLYRASIDASIIIEIIKINSEFQLESDWGKRSEILWKFKMYSEYSGIRVSHEVIQFLYDITYLTRSGMPSDVSGTILNLIFEYFPHPENKIEKKQTIKIAEMCSNIGFGIAYDAFLYLNNLSVACNALEILKFIHLKGKQLKLTEISKFTQKQYAELERNLDRKERDDLENAKRFLKLFKDDLETPGLIHPNLPDDLHRLMIKHLQKTGNNPLIS